MLVSGIEGSSVKSGLFGGSVRKAEYTTGTFHIKVEKRSGVDYFEIDLYN